MRQVSGRLSAMPRAAWLVIGLLVIGSIVGVVAYYQFVVLRPYQLILPLGLKDAELKIPVDNALSAKKIALGKQLYFDPRLSGDGTISCATCHNPQFGWTDGQPVSVGAGGQKGGRSAPTVINRAFSTNQFWDGRAASLEEQALGPIQNPIEMAMTVEDLIPRIQAIEGYQRQFREVFGSEVTAENVARAIAAFERTVLSGDSDFDRFQAGDQNALSAEAQRGMNLFFGKAQCASCHGGSNFTDEQFHNLGVTLSEGAAPAEPHQAPDLGRYDVTKDDRDKGKFRTPTLRHIAQTAPYMHDGSLKTLEEVMEFYNRGGSPGPNLDPLIRPLNLAEQEIVDLVAFMQALTGRMPEVGRPELPK